MFRRRGEPERAFSELKKASDLNPSEAKILALRALALSDMGEQAPARADADKAIAASPNSASAYYARGLISFREGKPDAAGTDAEKALTLDAKLAAAHVLMGRIAEERGDKNGAEARYRRALDTPAKSVDARSAHDEARERLKAIGAEAPPKVVASSTPPSKPVSETAATASDCRKFIPSASVTISVDCSD
jgi:tetratricopeptide (TPR) repeat protein